MLPGRRCNMLLLGSKRFDMGTLRLSVVFLVSFLISSIIISLSFTGIVEVMRRRASSSNPIFCPS